MTISRTVYATVADVRGCGFWSIGDTEDEARAIACDRLKSANEQRARRGSATASEHTEAEWAGRLTVVAITGSTEQLKALVNAVDEVAPWCPADLRGAG